MVSRNRSYLHIDGTFVCLDDLICIYITPNRRAIVCRFIDGQQTEIKYAEAASCKKAWDGITTALKADIEVGGIYIFPHRTIILRVLNLRYAEFDTIDNRFILQYKDGSTYIFRYPNSKITYEIFKRIMKALFGEDVSDDLPIDAERHRADFWTDPITTIDGLTVGDEIPNSEYWARIDKAFVDARKNLAKGK